MPSDFNVANVKCFQERLRGSPISTKNVIIFFLILTLGLCDRVTNKSGNVDVNNLFSIIDEVDNTEDDFTFFEKYLIVIFNVSNIETSHTKRIC